MDLNAFIQALVLGIIEGITEFLPISSTGHLIIAEQWLGQRSDMFNIVIQAGAILAVTVIYWQRLVSLATGWSEQKNFNYMAKLLFAFLVTAVLGLTVKTLGFKLPETVTPIAWALVIGGLWMIAAEQIAARRPESRYISWTVALAVGLAQVVAGVFPGTSRSASTIFAAMLLGTGNRAAATEFAFLVGIPTMYAASAFELMATLKDGSAAHENWPALAVAFVVSALTAFIAVKWLLGFIQGHRFTSFAVYRIALGLALFAMAAVGWVS